MDEWKTLVYDFSLCGIGCSSGAYAAMDIEPFGPTMARLQTGQLDGFC
jgi:hypothetical protein